MEYDYSEYELDEIEKYELQHSGRKDAILEFFLNTVRFNEQTGNIVIQVDNGMEWYNMADDVNKYDEITNTGREIINDEDEKKALKDLEEHYCEAEAYNADKLKDFTDKYDISFTWDENDIEYFLNTHPDGKLEPKINVLSGATIKLKCGQGLLDFIYADFITPTKRSLMVQKGLESIIGKPKADTKVEDKPRKILNKIQLEVEDWYDYQSTMTWINDIAYQSLYSAICPPILKGKLTSLNATKFYGNYILSLQDEYKKLIEFCFDESFYPEVLGDLMPYERYYIYGNLSGHPIAKRRTEKFSISRATVGKQNPPYTLSIETILGRFSATKPLTAQHEELAAKYNYDPDKLRTIVQLPQTLYKRYEFRSINDILELEFTKMLEENIRFRKCKRCGKYFIMKGNYDTNYCDRIEPGTTRTCKDLAAQENYKKKNEGNEAIALYQKYYKRYAARVKVRQIKEPNFKKWKYEALVKRDECSDGIITVAEFTEWLESCFPNRKPKV